MSTVITTGKSNINQVIKKKKLHEKVCAINQSRFDPMGENYDEFNLNKTRPISQEDDI